MSNPANIIIKGSDHFELELFGHVLFDENTPFDFTIPLRESGVVSHDFDPVEVTLGVDGDTISVGVSIEGFPLFTKSGSLSQVAKSPLAFDEKAFGDSVSGTISIQEVS